MARKKHGEHVNLERWLVSYADFITLLFAFFVIMYAISRADMQKFKAMSEGMKRAFGQGSGDGGSGGTGAGTGGGDSARPFVQPVVGSGPVVDLPAGKTNGRVEGSADLKQLADVLEESLSLELGRVDMGDRTDVSRDRRGVVVRLSAKDFYEPGSAIVRAEALPLLDKMARILRVQGHRVRVEGHTDNSKSVSREYASNWELSTARATWIVRYLIQNWQFDPHLLEAAGYAEFHPVTSNETEPGRARNRRVELVVLEKDSL